MIDITCEQTPDGLSISVLGEGLVAVSPDLVQSIVEMDAESSFFPYEIHPVVYRGRPVKHPSGMDYLFEVSLILDCRMPR